MSTPVLVLIIVLVGLACFAGGFFAARKYMEDYLKKNPPINEQMLSTIMVQMGQKPSEKKLHQMMSAMKANMDKKESYV